MPAKTKRKPPASKPVQKTKPSSTGKAPVKSPHWVSLDALARAWVKGEELRTGKTGLLAKYTAEQKSRARQASYESACWFALFALKMHDAGRNLQVMCMDQKLPCRITTGVHEIYLGFVEPGEAVVARASKQVAAGRAVIAGLRSKVAPDAIAAPRQRVSAKDARAQAKVRKAAPAPALAQTGRSRQRTRG